MATANKKELIPVDVVVGFAGGDVSDIQALIRMEMDDRIDEEQFIKGAMRIRHYPSGLNALNAVGSTPAMPGLPGIRYSCTIGGFAWTNEYRFRNVSGTLEFTGTDRVQLPYPPNAWMSDSSYFHMEKVGGFLDFDGKPIGIIVVGRGAGLPNLRVDYRACEIIASQPCYGTVTYDYTTSYRILRYWPPSYVDVYGTMIPNVHGYGKMMAVQPMAKGQPFITSLQVSPPALMNQSIELYRIEYTVIVNSEGTWEKPTSWPINGEYEGSTTFPIEDRVLDNALPYMEVPRLLEVAYFSLSDPEIENAGKGSVSAAMPVPLTFDRAERSKNIDAIIRTAGIIVDVEKFTKRTTEYWQDIRNFPPPKYRTATYQYQFAKPYDKTARGPEWSQFIWVEKLKLYFEVTQVFRINLRIVPGKIPRELPAPTPEQKNAMTPTDYQIGKVNNTLYRAWDAIDWRAIKNDIKARYPDTLFSYTMPDLLIAAGKLEP
jgi:hypothetical protein